MEYLTTKQTIMNAIKIKSKKLIERIDKKKQNKFLLHAIP